jgi:hypothetical protein
MAKRSTTSVRAKPEIAQALTAVPAQAVLIAAVGDVATDWAFFSREPSPPQSSDMKPWTRDTATRLYALPGGAWFSGHMLQGALTEPPIFERSHTFTISSNPPFAPTHVIQRAITVDLADSKIQPLQGPVPGTVFALSSPISMSKQTTIRTPYSSTQLATRFIGR